MFLEVQDESSSGSTLVDAASCDSLAVIARRSMSNAQLDHLLRSSGWGQSSGPQGAALSIARLRSEAIRAGCNPVEFEGMLSFASTRGWLSPDGEFVIAHVERK